MNRLRLLNCLSLFLFVAVLAVLAACTAAEQSAAPIVRASFDCGDMETNRIVVVGSTATTDETCCDGAECESGGAEWDGPDLDDGLSGGEVFRGYDPNETDSLNYAAGAFYPNEISVRIDNTIVIDMGGIPHDVSCNGWATRNPWNIDPTKYNVVAYCVDDWGHEFMVTGHEYFSGWDIMRMKYFGQIVTKTLFAPRWYEL